MRHGSNSSPRGSQHYDDDDNLRHDDTSTGSDSGPESEPSPVLSPSQRVYIPSPIPHHLVRYTDLIQYMSLLLLLANVVSSTMMHIVKR